MSIKNGNCRCSKSRINPNIKKRISERKQCPARRGKLLPTETRCVCRSEFAGLKAQQGEFIEGSVYDNCQFGTGFGYTAPGLNFQALLLQSVTCLLNNTMTAIGIGKLSGRFVDFEIVLTRNPNTINLRVFKCQETFIHTVFRGSEVARISLICCPR